MYRSPVRYAGYTLLELVIVIFIIGLVSAVILLRTGTVRFDRKVSVFAEQLSSFIQVCQQQAILQPAVIGVIIRPDHYEAYYFSENESLSQNAMSTWQSLGVQDSFWKIRGVPSDIALSVNSSAPLNISGLAPQIVVQPSGDFSAFSIDIGYVGEPARYRLIGNTAGEILLERAL